MKKYFIAIVLLLLLFSCKSRKLKNDSGESNPNFPTDISAPITENAFFFNKILEKSDFESLKINSKVDVQSEKNIPTIDATMYLEKDKKVWMNLSFVVFGVARGIATPSGIKAYEKINGTYIDSDYKYLNNLLGVDFINFKVLQNILLGKTFVPINPRDFVLTKNEQGYSLNSFKNQKISKNNQDSEYKIHLNYADNFELMNLTIESVTTNEILAIEYSIYENFEKLRLPKNVKIIIKGEKNSQILIENTKFDSAKMATPYSVPKNYKKTIIK